MGGGQMEGDRFGSWDGVGFCLLWARGDATCRFGDGEGAVRIAVRLELG